MVEKLNNYLYAHRKRSGLTQKDIAYLLGHYDGNQVSRHERSRQKPSLIAAFAYQAIFGVPVEELFPGLYRDIKAEINRRADLLSKELKTAAPKPKASRKLAVLRNIRTRKAEVDENSHEVIR